MGLDDELVERIRTLRAAGCTAKQIARTVGVPAARVTALVRAIAAEQAAAQAVDGPRRLVGCWVSPEWWRPDGLVFTRPDGRPIRPDWLTHHFTALVAASGLPPVRLHDLRHGAATLALAAHVELKTVQDMLGHTSYAFTADTYATVLPEQARQAAESTARLVRDAVDKVPLTGSESAEPVLVAV